jgi:hypothetical protein
MGHGARAGRRMSALAEYAAIVGPWAYVWPTLALLTVLALPVSVAVLAWRERGQGSAHIPECDARHTVNLYSVAPYGASVATSTTTRPGQPSPAETE